jgi:DNA primase large subunit
MEDRIYCSPSMFINSSESDKTWDFYRAALTELLISKWIMSKDVRRYGRVLLSRAKEDKLLDRLAKYIQKRAVILEDLLNQVAELQALMPMGKTILERKA